MKKIVVVQCRLGSTRLKQKALRKLDGKTVLEFVLTSMSKVNADDYYVVTDYLSEKSLEPIVQNAGWKIFAGSEFDVLERFCSMLRFVENNDIYNFPDYIIRATADNPFLFYDAANEMSERYEQLIKEQSKKIDYFTWTGLPHGSGVEILNVSSLLDSINYTSSPYDHEHVGPALYNHTERYNCIFENAPEKYNFPQLRTTIDTLADYYFARSVIACAKQEQVELKIPLSTQKIIEYRQNENVCYPVLFVPTIKKENGTGHFRRCLELASRLGAHLYFKRDENPQLAKLLDEYLQKLKITEEQIVEDEIPVDYYKIIVLDSFCTSQKEIDYYSSFSPVITIDDGASEKVLQKSSFNINIIPSLIDSKNLNFSSTEFIPLPFCQKERKSKNFSEIKKILISFGGYGNEKFLDKVQSALKELSAIQSDFNYEITILKDCVENLKDKLYEYDLVFTHYGFTAFESASSNCIVITVPPTNLHKKLSLNVGLPTIDYKNLTGENLKKLILEQFEKEDSDFICKLRLQNKEKNDAYGKLTDYIRNLSKEKLYCCPNCKTEKSYLFDKIVSRDKVKTIRFCSNCNLEYISFLNKEKTQYTSNYFFQDYKNQYGKTYLEDFESIKQSGLERQKIVNRYSKSPEKKRLLDIGCAYGPYLSAVSESSSSPDSWEVVGLDVCAPAVYYVKQELKFKAFVENFQDDFSFEFKNEIEQNGKFDAITMWYVIEHFENLDVVLKNVSSLLKDGGVFAFSTPSSSGVSAKKNTKDFYEQSPSDHYSIWNPKKANKVLSKYGFKVKKIVYTGVHPERYPIAKKQNLKDNSFRMKFLKFHANVFHHGDTFEIYCVKQESKANV